MPHCQRPTLEVHGEWGPFYPPDVPARCTLPSHRIKRRVPSPVVQTFFFMRHKEAEKKTKMLSAELFITRCF